MQSGDLLSYLTFLRNILFFLSSCAFLSTLSSTPAEVTYSSAVLLSDKALPLATFLQMLLEPSFPKLSLKEASVKVEETFFEGGGRKS
jgi:hypothetical protein